MEAPTPKIPDRHKAAHFETKVISRGGGRSASAAAAYRAGERIVDERTDLIHDFRNKGGVKANLIIGPEGSEKWSASQLWNAAEVAEDKLNPTRAASAATAREFIISLPNELPTDKAIALCRSYGEYLQKTHGVVVMASLHDPDLKADELRIRRPGEGASNARYNLHCHFLFTDRRVEVGEKGEPVFGEKATEFNKRKFGVKKGEPNGSDTIQACRREWEKQANAALDSIGFVGARVDMRSHEARAKETGEKVVQAPKERHLGPRRTAEKRRHEGRTERLRREGETPPRPPRWLEKHEQDKTRRKVATSALRREILAAERAQETEAERAARVAAAAAAKAAQVKAEPARPIKKKPQPADELFGPKGLLAPASIAVKKAQEKERNEVLRAIEAERKAAEKRHQAAEKEDADRLAKEAKVAERKAEAEDKAEAADEAWEAKQKAEWEAWRARQRAKDRGADR